LGVRALNGPNGFIGSTEASRILKVSTTTLLKLVKAGRLTPAFYMPGGAARFDAADVVAMAESQRVAS
jgi:excisionase family DNA binding protein